MGVPKIPTGISTGIGSLYRTEVVQAIAAASRFIIPVGAHYVVAVGANCRLQVVTSDGTWNNLTAAGVVPPGHYDSDGASVAVWNGGGASENITYIQTS